MSFPTKKNIPYTTKFGDFDIVIENPKGSNRYWKDPITGEDGVTHMLVDYGYFSHSLGLDGDSVDCFVGPNEQADYAYVIKQRKVTTGKLDEAKVMLGFDSAKEAKDMYLKHYDNPDFYGGMTPYHKDVLKMALKESKNNPAVIKAKLTNA